MTRAVDPRLAAGVAALVAGGLISALPTSLRAEAPSPAAGALGQAVRQLCCAMIDWDDLDKARSIRWAGAGPTMLAKIAPDGSGMARGGSFDVAGERGEIFAAGARIGVMTYYMRTPPLGLGEQGIAAMLRAAGLRAELARCPLTRGATRERLWFKVSAPKGDTAIFYAGPQTTGPGDAYALYLKAELPLLQPGEVGRFSDQCGAAAAGAPKSAAASAPAFPTQGYQAVATVLADWVDMAASGRIPYATLRRQPGVKWQTTLMNGGGFHLEEVWDEKGPRFTEGELKTATTEMRASAWGDAAAASRLYLKHGANLPRGGVFAELEKRGYTVATLRCGKPYTEESTDWRRITSPSGRSAVLAYTVMVNGGQREENYALRLDNVLPPLRTGEANASACRSL